MPVYLNDDERKIILKENKGPGPMLDLMSTAGFRAADAALRLGVFEALKDGALSAAAVAERTAADQRGTQILLDILEVFGYVQQDEEHHYANTPMTTRWLFAPAEGGYDYTIVHRFWSTILFQLWGTLEQSLQQGHPALNFYEWLEEHPDTRHDFHRMLSGIAHLNAPRVVEQVSLPENAARLLDLGGGHGLYTIAFCRRHETLQGVIFDYPGAVEVGRTYVEQAELAERIRFEAGNFMQDDLGQGYDVVLLFSIVHGLLPEQNVTLLQRVAEALNPGGMVIILEQLAGERGKRPSPFTDTFNRVFKLNLYHLLGAQTYTLDEVEQWLQTAGYEDYSHHILDVTNDTVITAKKPPAK